MTEWYYWIGITSAIWMSQSVFFITTYYPALKRWYKRRQYIKRWNKGLEYDY